MICSIFLCLEWNFIMSVLSHNLVILSWSLENLHTCRSRCVKIKKICLSKYGKNKVEKSGLFFVIRKRLIEWFSLNNNPKKITEYFWLTPRIQLSLFFNVVEVHHDEMQCECCANVRSVSAVRSSSVTDNLRWRHHTISGYESTCI